MFSRYLCPLLCAMFGCTAALVLRGTEEGTCLRNVPYHRDIDHVWLDSLPYVIGGNKYYLYRQASVNPQFSQMREFEFYYDSCFVKNTSIIEGNGSVFGFGRVLGSFDVRQASNQGPGVFVAVPRNPQTGSPSGYYTYRVTLTDYRTFAVLVQCWEGTNQRSFNVFSAVPQLDKATERLIEDHVQSLNFQRENVVFLRYENCDLDAALSNRRNGTGGGVSESIPGNKFAGAGGFGYRVQPINKNLKRNVINTMRTTTTTTTTSTTTRRPPVVVTTAKSPSAEKKIMPALPTGGGSRPDVPSIGSGWTSP